MKIEILGSRGKIKPSAPNYENHSGILIDDTLLLDVGEKEYLQRKPGAIIFTHFHPDHAYFEFEKNTFSPNIPVYGPEKNSRIPDLEIITDKIFVKDYVITPIPVIHAKDLKSLGYVIEKKQKRIFITGDVAWIEKEHLQKISPVDLIITEATLMKKGGRINRSGNKIFGHTGIPDLIRIFKTITKKIVFTHYGDWFFEDVKQGPVKIKELEPEGIALIPAFDGFKIEI